MAIEKFAKKPHAVCFPYPSQSHIGGMLKMAKLLYYRGFHITFVHTEYNYNRLLKSRGPNSLDGSPGFNFEAIPDGLPPAENGDVTQDAFQLPVSIAKNCYAPFSSLLKKLNNKASISDHFPPVSCIITDCLVSFALEAAEELGIPHLVLWCVSAISSMCFSHIPQLYERGYTPLKDESYYKNGYMENSIDWIPGINSIRLKDMPTTIWTTDPKSPFLEFALHLTPRQQRASAFIMNTFDALEHDVVKQFPNLIDRVYTIGPMHLLLKEVEKENGHAIESIQSNLWKEDNSCIEWLNSKRKGSVVYVNFGSVTVMSKAELDEFAWGLANSMQNFLLVIRPDLVKGDPSSLPPEFIKATKDRGMITTSWCNQVLVLNHPSIGAFLTHCGWNSILESLSAGVPLMCWPFFADQQTNCLCCCYYWGVGIEIDSDVDRVGVENVVREVMEGAKGKKLKKAALEWKNSAQATTKPTGSSYMNMDKLVREIPILPKPKESFN